MVLRAQSALPQTPVTVFMTVERGKDSNPRVVEVSRRKMRDLGALGLGRRSREPAWSREIERDIAQSE
jgi:hypothetical protein